MSSAVWKLFDNVSTLLSARSGPDQYSRADSVLDAAMETIADILPTATHDLLEEGAVAARAVLHGQVRKLGAENASASYVAGRLSAIVDVLGHAARQTVDEAQISIVRQQPYASLLSALHARPLRNTDLVDALGKDKSQVSKWLETCRQSGVVVSQKQGREVFNALTPLGRSILQEGVQRRNRVPLREANVHSMEASRRFDLKSIETPVLVDGGNALPVISAALR